jgi:transposase
MARIAEGPAAEKHRARLPATVGLRRNAVEAPRHPVCRVSGAGWARSQSHGLRHRQPKREERRKRGRSIDPPGYDAGKKTKGKKRHVLVDTLGLMLHAIVHAADIQDRDGGGLVLQTLFGRFPFLTKLFADGGYHGPIFASAAANVMPDLRVEIVKRSDATKGFQVLPKRWVVERSLAWFGRCRRLAKDFENLNRTAMTFLRLASIRLMLRRLCNVA